MRADRKRVWKEMGQEGEWGLMMMGTMNGGVAVWVPPSLEGHTRATM